MLYKNVVLCIVGVLATRQLNIYQRNWVVSRTHVNNAGDLYKKKGKEKDGQLCNGCHDGDYRQVRTFQLGINVFKSGS